MARKLTKEEKTQAIDEIIANSVDGAWTEKDRPVLNSLSSKKVVSLLQHVAYVQNNLQAEQEATASSLCPLTGQIPACSVRQPFSTDPPVNNEEGEPKMKTEQEWLNDAPENIRSVVLNAMQLDAEQKKELIAQITANANNPFDKAFLEGLTTNELKPLAQLAGKPAAPRSYVGAGAGQAVLNADDGQEDLLPMPKMTFDKDRLKARA